MENWTVDRIAERLNGVDTVIVTIYFQHLDLQKPLADAAKKAGVKRFITDDWATACVPGIRIAHDEVSGPRQRWNGR